MGNKGAQFERDLCRKFSLWWTRGKRDDVFWRTHGSGGRAKVRSKMGKRTHEQHADMCAIDPIGAPLIDLLTIEMKKGYPKTNALDLFDRGLLSAQTQIESWLQRLIEDSATAGSFSWALAVRRPQRQITIFWPRQLQIELRDAGCFASTCNPLMRIDADLRLRYQIGPKKFKTSRTEITIYGTTLDQFLNSLDPKRVRALCKLV